ncbi:MAG TPA: hypothetical protein ENJ24_02810 [Gammaproteobacteria bacterium]|nr:hypothetical protein [Gammaproteobacteria bacterium]
MKHRKPDILVVLALSVGLGVLVTGYAENLFHADSSAVTRQPVDDTTRQFSSFSHGEVVTKEHKDFHVNN